MDYVELVKSAATVLAAAISAVALIKVNRIDNQDRIRRSLWAMEEYMLALGKCIENPKEENREAYKACYMLCNLYADEGLRMEMKKIDSFISREDMESAKAEALDLTIRYSEKYKMRSYAPRRRIFRLR